MVDAERMRAGTLQYSFRSMVMVFVWLLIGSFGFYLLSSAVAQLLPLTLKSLNSNNFTIGILVGSIPAALNMMINPVISFRSDRTRTKWGRRKPYLLFATPFLAMLLIAIGWLPQILSAFGVPPDYMTIVSICAIALLIVAFQVFYLFVGSTIYYLFVDVVPIHYIGRYMAFFNLVGALNGFVFQRWFLKMFENSAAWLYSGIAVFYFGSIMIMLLMVKEGEYPPIKAVEKKPFRQRFQSGVKTYFIECFSIPFYIWLFLAMAINGSSTICRSLFGTIYAQENLSLELSQIGEVGSYGALISILLALPLGFLNDKIHPLKIFSFGAVLIIILNAFSFFLIKDYNSYMLWTLTLVTAYAIQGSSALPMSAKLFPQSHYGQFGSAQAVFCSVVLIVANAGGGLFMDIVKDYSYMFVWDFVLTFVALLSLVKVFKLWNQYGGEANYIAPLRTDDSI